MPTTQPIWKLVANLGDTHPITYGGHFVYIDETGVYLLEAEVLIEPPDDRRELKDNRNQWTVYRYNLELCTFENGILSDNKFHKDSEVWFSDSLESIAGNIGTSKEELIAQFTSSDPIQRANAWHAVGEYHGFDNLDSYPLTLTYRETLKRYEKEGVTK